MKKMKKICSRSEDTTQYIVYDTSIPDLQERRDSALTFVSGRAMCRAIGINKGVIARYVSKEAIAEKRRFYSERLRKTFAIRIYKTSIF